MKPLRDTFNPLGAFLRELFPRICILGNKICFQILRRIEKEEPGHDVTADRTLPPYHRFELPPYGGRNGWET
jgi:hypothetical protein